ncbi:Nucleoside diphosphate kinase B [Dictyocoela muelleri]|nr:Nucleoside diphosphate kinase B [Dictyocoela muelleri]
MEYTFIMIKPEGVKRRLVSEIIGRFEKKGLKLCGMKMCSANIDILNKHYAEHLTKDFWPEYCQHLLSGPVIPMVWSGKNAVDVARQIIGATNPINATNGSIRGDFGMDIGRNIVHGADSKESAIREVEIWFGDDFFKEASFDHSLIYE